MTTRLFIIRHGNTFESGETPRRVGVRTDIPLVGSGRAQAVKIGEYLKAHDMMPDTVFSSQLIRARQTAEILCQAAGADIDVYIDKSFNEIDHGVDENTTDDDVISRIGKDALDKWNKNGVVPDGWDVDIAGIQKSWVAMADDCLKNRAEKTTVVVSSGGIIKFAPVITNGIIPAETSKVGTGSISCFDHDGTKWVCTFWNKRPDDGGMKI